MSRADINVSGAHGSGTSVKIYETSEHALSWGGGCIMHGTFTAGPTSPDDQRIEVVELCLPGLDIRVRAKDVQVELQELLIANKTWRDASWSAELQPARHQAFTDLRAAVWGAASRGITTEHIEQVARDAYEDGRRHGEETERQRFREMLGRDRR